MTNTYKKKQTKKLTIPMNLSNVRMLTIRKDFDFPTDIQVKQVFENLAPVSSGKLDASSKFFRKEVNNHGSIL